MGSSGINAVHGESKKQLNKRMSDFCDFVPDDPSCIVEPEPVDPVGPAAGEGGDMDMMDDDMDKDMSMEMM